MRSVRRLLTLHVQVEHNQSTGRPMLPTCLPHHAAATNPRPGTSYMIYATAPAPPTPQVYFAGEHPSFPEGGKVSQSFERLAIGDCLEVKGPLGHFVYNGMGSYTLNGKLTLKATHMSFVAGGTGEGAGGRGGGVGGGRAWRGAARRVGAAALMHWARAGEDAGGGGLAANPGLCTRPITSQACAPAYPCARPSMPPANPLAREPHLAPPPDLLGAVLGRPGHVAARLCRRRLCLPLRGGPEGQAVHHQVARIAHALRERAGRRHRRDRRVAHMACARCRHAHMHGEMRAAGGAPHASRRAAHDVEVWLGGGGGCSSGHTRRQACGWWMQACRSHGAPPAGAPFLQARSHVCPSAMGLGISDLLSCGRWVVMCADRCRCTHTCYYCLGHCVPQLRLRCMQQPGKTTNRACMEGAPMLLH